MYKLDFRVFQRPSTSTSHQTFFTISNVPVEHSSSPITHCTNIPLNRHAFKH